MPPTARSPTVVDRVVVPLPPPSRRRRPRPGRSFGDQAHAFAAGPSTFVAVETHGFSRDDLLAFAASTDPVDPAAVPPIPLLLAAANTTPQPGQRRDGLLGGVIG